MSYIIKDFDKFTEQCRSYDKAGLRALLFNWAFQRTLLELVLVDAINNCDDKFQPIPKEKTLSNLENSIKGERILIGLLGRREAAKVYGNFEGITSDVKTVDMVLETDFVKHYQSVLDSQQTKAKP
jgi:hypothetical protein